MTSKKWMNEKENILLQSFGEDNRTDYDWALETSSIIIRDTEFHPVKALPSVLLGHFPTHNSTVTLPCEMFSQYPSNDL